MYRELNLIFQRHDRERERTMVIPSEASVEETCETIRALLGLPAAIYSLGIARNGTVIESLDFSDAEIQQNERLTLVPVNLIQEWKNAHTPKSIPSNTQPHEKKEKPETDQDSSTQGNEYQLFLTIGGDEKDYHYSVKLKETHENNPLDFFRIPDGAEYKKFKEFLQSKHQKETNDSDSSRILKKWCKDIEQGYRTVSLKW